MITALTSTKPEGPRRRFRGKKRYFRRVSRDASTFRIEPGQGEWWDLWHYHADWPGWGNIRWRYRREHIRALAAVFEHIARSADRFTPRVVSSFFIYSPAVGVPLESA